MDSPGKPTPRRAASVVPQDARASRGPAPRSAPDEDSRYLHVGERAPERFGRGRVWQERSRFVKKAKVGGADVKWNGGKFKQRVQADAVTEFNVELDASSFK